MTSSCLRCVQRSGMKSSGWAKLRGSVDMLINLCAFSSSAVVTHTSVYSVCGYLHNGVTWNVRITNP